MNREASCHLGDQNDAGHQSTHDSGEKRGHADTGTALIVLLRPTTLWSVRALCSSRREVARVRPVQSLARTCGPNPTGRRSPPSICKTDRERGQVGGTHCRGFAFAGPDNWYIHQIRLELHQEVVSASAAIYAKFGHFNARIGFHRGQNVGNLERYTFQGCSDDVGRGAAAG
jgi:hypothetical protein